MQKKMRRASLIALGSAGLMMSLLPVMPTFAATSGDAMIPSVTLSESGNTFMAKGVDRGSTPLEYQFVVTPPNGHAYIAQRFMTANTFKYTAPGAGYTVQANAMTAYQVQHKEWDIHTGSNVVVATYGAATVSNGSVLHLVNSSNEYVVAHGTLHWVPNAATFNAMGLSWNKAQAVRAFPLPVGRPVDLIKQASSPRVYVEKGGQLHWITTSRAFNALGYPWRDVFTVRYLPLPIGSPVTGITQSHIVLYAADPVDYASAQRIASQQGLSLAQVTGNYATAWADTASGADLVIAVGAPANNALYFNPSGWAGKPAGHTPFATTRGWMSGLPGRNYYESAAGSSAQVSFDLATDAVEYALGHSLSYHGLSVYPPQNVRSGENPVS